MLAVAAGDEHRRRAELVQPLGELRRAARSKPARATASGRFGVTTVASGKSRRTSASTASSSSSFAPELATITGSTTSGTRMASRKPATVSISAPREEHPGLRRVDADVGEDRVELRDARTPAAARGSP